jgi:hypothetical protein
MNDATSSSSLLPPLSRPTLDLVREAQRLDPGRRETGCHWLKRYMADDLICPRRRPDADKDQYVAAVTNGPARYESLRLAM